MSHVAESDVLHSCVAYTVQQRNNEPDNGNSQRNEGATGSLKALANKVLKRNEQRNSGATSAQKGRNNPATNDATVAGQLQPVVNHGRTFRQCPKCKRMGWHPQASAEICCGQAMNLIEHPALTVPDYVEFVGSPNTCASGKISHAEVVDMMKRDLIQPLPDNEKASGGDSVRSI